MFTKIDTLFRSFAGNFKKISFYFSLLFNIRIKRADHIDNSVVVSLTSYGERVSNSAALAVFSILKQNLSPYAVVLWLDKFKWNDNNLPKSIKYLKKNGLTVKYCKDIRSYTKLLPALNEYPDKCIVTVDDDVYYSKDMLSELVNVHIKNPDAICCLHFCVIRLADNGSLLPYYEWEECHVVPNERIIDQRFIFPQGYGGVLYPVNVFDESVHDVKHAMELCPTADDVWFYCMGVKNKKKRAFANNSKTNYLLVDMFRQLLKKDRLNEANVKIADNNEVQMKRVLDYYNLSII